MPYVHDIGKKDLLKCQWKITFNENSIKNSDKRHIMPHGSEI